MSAFPAPCSLQDDFPPVYKGQSRNVCSIAPNNILRPYSLLACLSSLIFHILASIVVDLAKMNVRSNRMPLVVGGCRNWFHHPNNAFQNLTGYRFASCRDQNIFCEGSLTLLPTPSFLLAFKFFVTNLNTFLTNIQKYSVVLHKILTQYHWVDDSMRDSKR